MIDLGLPISLIGCAISLYGMYLNNQKHDHKGAMRMWFWSNPILMAYFIGQSFAWWNGGLSSAAMAGLYAVFTVSNWKGLQEKKEEGKMDAKSEWTDIQLGFVSGWLCGSMMLFITTLMIVAMFKMGWVTIP